MVSRSKAIKTVIAGGVGVAVVGLSVDAAWPSPTARLQADVHRMAGFLA